MESFYKKIYRQTWQIIKANWYLLFFGVFIMAMGLTGEFKAIFTLGEDTILTSIRDWLEILRGILNLSANLNDLSIFSQVLGTFFFFAVILVLGISSQGALIYAADKSHKDNGKKNGVKEKFSESLRTGVENFWPLLGLNILNKLVAMIFVAGVISPIIYMIYLANNPPLANLLVAIVIFFSFIPLCILISFITRYGAAYIVLKNKKIIPAFFEGWRLFQVNWILSLENAVVLTLLTSLYTILALSLLAFITVPLLILSYLILQISVIGFWILIFAGTLTLIVVFIIATAFYGTFYTIVWTETFLRLTSKEKAYSKTERLLKRHWPNLNR